MRSLAWQLSQWSALSPLEKQLVPTLWYRYTRDCMYLTVGQYTVHQRHQVNWYPTFKAHLREVYTIHIVFLVEVGFRPSPTGEEKPTKNFYASKRGGIFYNVVHELTAKWIYFIIQFFYRKSNCRFMVTHYVK